MDIYKEPACAPARMSVLLFSAAIILLAICMTAPLTAADQESVSRKISPKSPIHIKSDRMEAMDKNGTVIFKGNVIAVKGDLTINADRLDVIYTEKKEKKSGGRQRRVLKKIVATGHVKIVQGKKVGTGQKAIYDKQAEKLVLTGDAQVWEGSNRIKGNRITLYINEDRSVVESSGSQKVEATVYSD